MATFHPSSVALMITVSQRTKEGHFGCEYGLWGYGIINIHTNVEITCDNKGLLYFW